MSDSNGLAWERVLVSTAYYLETNIITRGFHSEKRRILWLNRAVNLWHFPVSYRQALKFTIYNLLGTGRGSPFISASRLYTACLHLLLAHTMANFATLKCTTLLYSVWIIYIYTLYTQNIFFNFLSFLTVVNGRVTQLNVFLKMSTHFHVLYSVSGTNLYVLT
jgi:hypothetical protein